MAERLSRRLVLLSSATISVVYLAGYLETRSADASLGRPAETTTTGTTAGTAATTDAAQVVACST